MRVRVWKFSSLLLLERHFHRRRSNAIRRKRGNVVVPRLKLDTLWLRLVCDRRVSLFGAFVSMGLSTMIAGRRRNDRRTARNDGNFRGRQRTGTGFGITVHIPQTRDTRDFQTASGLGATKHLGAEAGVVPQEVLVRKGRLRRDFPQSIRIRLIAPAVVRERELDPTEAPAIQLPHEALQGRLAEIEREDLGGELAGPTNDESVAGREPRDDSGVGRGGQHEVQELREGSRTVAAAAAGGGGRRGGDRRTVSGVRLIAFVALGDDLVAVSAVLGVSHGHDRAAVQVGVADVANVLGGYDLRVCRGLGLEMAFALNADSAGTATSARI